MSNSRSQQQSSRPSSIGTSTAWPNQQKTKWLFTSAELKSTPSIREGMSVSSELHQRAKGASFLVDVGMQLRLPPPTLYVAAVMFHRFYMRFPMKRFHPYDISGTCIFLATKNEETTRKLKDIVVACCRVAHRDSQLYVDEQDKEFWRWRDIILFNEELLLEALCFDFIIETPYQLLLSYTVRFVNDNEETSVHANTINRSAWAFINDSVRTTLCLRYPVSVIAASALYCASTIHSIPVGIPSSSASDNNKQSIYWWQQIKVDIRFIKHACNVMADLYDPVNGSAKAGSTEQHYTRH
ncbi:cyclin-like protein [Lipomyces oligophaga]|uniref:cyclin-like protein n=1 Tax=Lipomyces oligophaga TaxID=45792 RepID=UPI0034CF82EC